MINLTQHDLTVEQSYAVISFMEPALSTLHELLTFDELPSKEEIEQRAARIAQMALETGHTEAMIGGAPYLMAPLETALRNVGIEPRYAFSERVSEEQVQPDGSVRKVNVFRHVGFV